MFVIISALHNPSDAEFSEVHSLPDPTGDPPDAAQMYAEGRYRGGDYWWAYVERGALKAGMRLSRSETITLIETIDESEWFLFEVEEQDVESYMRKLRG